MIYFAQAQYLFLLLLVPVFPVLYGLMQYRRTRRIRKFGDDIDIAKLSRDLGCRVVPISAVRGEGIDDLRPFDALEFAQALI